MAKMIPVLTDLQLNDIPSHAEAKLYRSLRDNLPDTFVVLFQVSWIMLKEEAQARDGEADFLVCNAKYGYLCIEVKGGGIAFDAESGVWSSIDRNNIKHEIKNPISQAMRAKYSISRKLYELPSWHNLGLDKAVRGHAVFFPDVKSTDLPDRPDMPTTLIGGALELKNPLPWIESVFAYWGASATNPISLDQSGINIILSVFARSFQAMPLISSRLIEQEQQRLILTQEQIRVLDFIRSHRRAAVSGGAGTGKTVLAVEKARRLANEGFHTLLTCYNRQLADHLAEICANICNLDVMGFHQLCHQQAERAKRITNRDLVEEARLTYPSGSYYDVHLPNALAYSLDVLPDRYDAIVCDEGQDFCEEYWVGIELLLSDFDKSPLYIFFDDNQNLYSRVSTFPIKEEPYCLSSNCRNTVPIHTGAYKYYKGTPVEPPKNPGDVIHYENAPSQIKQAAIIGARITELIAKQNVSPSDIAILIADARRKSDFYANLNDLILPKIARLSIEGKSGRNNILVDTIQRFKGLESQIVFLWGFDDLNKTTIEELLYVGMSRAKSLLFVIGEGKFE